METARESIEAVMALLCNIGKMRDKHLSFKEWDNKLRHLDIDLDTAHDFLEDALQQLEEEKEDGKRCK